MLANLHNRASRLLGTLALVATLAALGCNAADQTAKADTHSHDHGHDHDHGDRPESLDAAVAQLKSMHATIKTAILEGDPHDAHDPLHEIGELLEAIPNLAAETDLAQEDWDAVKAANEKLFDAFGAIDKAFHTKDGDKKAAFEQVSADLDEAIAEIDKRTPPTSEAASTPAVGHDDRDDHDHEGDESDETDDSGANP